MRSVSLALSIALATTSYAGVAFADKLTEAAAKAALKKAEDAFVAQNYRKGSLALGRAIKACGATKCTPATRAALLRDSGVMALRLGDGAGAAKAFGDAVAIEPDLLLNPKYDEPDVQKAFAEAKGESRGEPQTSANVAPGPASPAPVSAAPPADDKAHDADAKPKRPYRRFWVGIGGTLDFEALPKGTNLCRLVPEPPNTIVSTAREPENDGNVYCTNPDGSDFPELTNQEQNNALQPGSAGTSNGGIHRGEARLFLSFDYALSANFLAGARIGLSFFTYPGNAAYEQGRAWSFAGSQFYVNARASYLFGENAVEKTIAPMVFGGVGLASFATTASSEVTFTNGQTTTVNLWQTSGPFFVLLGAGAHIMVTESFGGVVGVRVNGSFGANGLIPTFGPEVGLQYGF